MVNPTIAKKEESSLILSERAKELFRVIYNTQNPDQKTDDGVPRIKVSTLISKMAFYYEKIRNSVDYKEEHLLRKNAIERILKREIVIQGTIKKAKSIDVAKHLLIELIRAAYLPNNTIPETKIEEIGEVIAKYLLLRKKVNEKINPAFYLKKGDVNQANEELKLRNELHNWIFALMASDIEERLGRDEVSRTVVAYMFDILSNNIVLPENSEYGDDLNIQIFLSIYRNYMRFDQDMLGFVLFKYFEKDWRNATDEQIERVGENILSLRNIIKEQLDHPLAKQIDRITSRYTVFFEILVDVVSDNPEEVYNSIVNDPKAFPRHIKRVCNKRYKTAKSKLWRSAIRSFIYIFLTKSVLAVLLEVPATKFFGQEVNNFSLFVNISFPALLLMVIVMMTRMPGDENTKKIIEGINEIFFVQDGKQTVYKLKRPIKKKGFMNAVFGLIYATTFVFSFGFIIWALSKIHFNWISTLIFIFFLALVSFFSIRIKKNSKQLIVVEPKENIFAFLADFFYIPIISVGKWLSEKFSKINVFIFVLDFIIEAPFKIFIEITEEWTKYVKERKEDII